MMGARRLRLETFKPWGETALEATLEALGAASLVVDERGCTKASNRLAREWVAANPAHAAAEVRRSLAASPGQGAFSVRRLDVEEGFHFLLVRRASMDQDRVARCVEEVVARHAVTPAQARVLALLATGASNRSIAVQLGVSERTVEVHITALLNELDADSRGGLIAFVLGR